MGGLIVMLVLALGIAVMMWVMADRIESGQSQPNMGNHTQESTTPESWEAMRVAVVEAIRWGAKFYAASAPLMLVVAALSGSAVTGVGFGGAAIALAAVPMVLGIIRANNLLVSASSTTS